MPIAGPNLQMPASMSDMLEVDAQGRIRGVKQEWASFFHSLQQTGYAASRNGPTSSRPTSTLDGRYIGMPYFDTTLNQEVFLASTNPDVWVTWASGGTGTLTSVAISSNISGLTISGSPATGAAGTITLSGSFSGLTSVALSSAITGISVSGSPVTTSGGRFTLTGGPFAAISTLAAVATTGAYASLSGTPTLGTAASTASSSYVFATSVGTAASTASSTYVFATSVGTVASTAASTWAIATEVFSSIALSSGAYGVSFTSASISPTVGTIALQGGAISSVVLSSSAYGIVISRTISSAAGTFTISGGAISSVSITSLVAGMNFSSRSVVSSASNQLILSGYLRHTYVSTVPGATLQLGQNVFSTAATAAVSTGVWLVMGQALVGTNFATSITFTAKLNSGTTSFSSGQVIPSDVVSSYSTIYIQGIFSSGAATSVTLDVAANVGAGSSFVRSQAWLNAAGSTATQLIALRLQQ